MISQMLDQWQPCRSRRLILQSWYRKSKQKKQKKKRKKLQLTLQDIMHLCQHGLCPNIVLLWKQLDALPFGLYSTEGRGHGRMR